jgi:hypothetical protein
MTALFDSVKSRNRLLDLSPQHRWRSAVLSLLVHLVMIVAIVRAMELASSPPVVRGPTKIRPVKLEKPVGLAPALDSGLRDPARNNKVKSRTPRKEPAAKPAFPVSTPVALSASDSGRVIVGVFDPEHKRSQPDWIARGSVMTGQIYGGSGGGSGGGLKPTGRVRPTGIFEPRPAPRPSPPTAEALRSRAGPRSS